ncbi:hypothetical protein DW114_12390 [Absiella sp. AM09-50]|jgi:hypothetical protein|nr:hypothetical protein DW271_09770 [Absiella sp. AM22-9]RGB56286.1 hypothetical protein DW120_17205 [Absiella sp. AM10-20]RGB65784.1 hypothetical protein DW113_10730 [Absiella sp. AM09-45]RGB74791.1 hypothetical protein DW114_12390 [Absiella sp. AM09-50]RGC49086.1 hypothetical protein DW761_13225 [Absiella sp. AM29-15]RHU10561.1 hypothetical protein DW716_00645 [Absiella sp. AM27-20]
MVSLYRRLFKSPYFLLFFLSLIQLYFRRYFIESNYTTPIDQWLITNNTITILVNNAFLLLQVKKMGVLKNVRDMVLIRIGKNNFYFQLYKMSFKGLTLYFFTTYIFLSLLFINTLSIVSTYFVFIILNLVIFSLYEVFFNYMIIEQKSTLYIIVPFIFNIVFHYVIVPILFFQI